MNEILPALCSGALSVIVCNPLDVIKINYQLNKRADINFISLYKGLGYGLLTIPTFWSIYFPTYKETKKILPISISAYISSCLASIITNPLWVLRQNSQTGVINHWNKPINTYFKGVYLTFLINLNFTVQIPVYEFLKNRINNNTTNIFLISAFSKTLSSLIFYPLDTLRVKIRNGSNFKNLPFRFYYKGISVYLLRSIPYHGTIFCSYEYIKFDRFR